MTRWAFSSTAACPVEHIERISSETIATGLSSEPGEVVDSFLLEIPLFIPPSPNFGCYPMAGSAGGGTPRAPEAGGFGTVTNIIPMATAGDDCARAIRVNLYYPDNLCDGDNTETIIGADITPGATWGFEATAVTVDCQTTIGLQLTVPGWALASTGPTPTINITNEESSGCADLGVVNITWKHGSLVVTKGPIYGRVGGVEV